MPSIDFNFLTPTPLDPAVTKVTDYLKADNSFKKLDSKLTWTYDESKKNVSLKGSQFSAQIQLKAENEGSRVHIKIEIPFLMMAFKSKIQDEVEKAIKKVLC